MSLTATADPELITTTLKGHITDATDGEPLVGVIVSIPELQESTVTDADGNYVFDALPQRTVSVQASYLGHQTQVRKIDLKKTAQLDFVMKEQNAMLGEVVVTGLTGKSLMKDSPTPISLVNADILRTTPATNIIDALSHQPGVAQVTTGGGISTAYARRVTSGGPSTAWRSTHKGSPLPRSSKAPPR